MTLTSPFEVIAAFIDGERVDPAALKSALAEPSGRDYLADLVALREVTAQDGVGTVIARSKSARPWIIGAAAAIVISLAGGFALGHRLAESTLPNDRATAAVAAPQPTRVIDVASGSTYTTQGGK